jgi:hypothetical protein
MKIETAYIRFFRSFNFDYLRRYGGKAEAEPWEDVDGVWIPYVRVPIDRSVTTVVGANEAGKSQLLIALRIALTGQGIDTRDFCRYSPYFVVQRGKRRKPDFGLALVNFTPAESDQLREIVDIPTSQPLDRLRVFRENGEQVRVYSDDGSATDLGDAQIERLNGLLPSLFEVRPDVALPASVPVAILTTRGISAKTASRRKRVALFGEFAEHPEYLESPQTFSGAAAAILQHLTPHLTAESPERLEQQSNEFGLARDLLFTIAGVDPTAFDDLERGVQTEDEGFVNAIITQINHELEKSLNFPKWWAQDRQFRLLVSSRDHDLAFTIEDRTKSQYSFSERSEGLRYFLSYYVQLRAHLPAETREEVLLMDEPDAFLSSQGQQDLLRVLEEFADPSDPAKPAAQVIYVTHSPFLINKNHGERIRVLDKGVGDEGTRVVRDASRNHYEPLRSSLGAFVGETAFIGSGNLFVEGLADQILLAGMASHLRARSRPETESLDLNQLTIVPAGSASHVPYMVYLARGRDVDRPAAVVLLDSDAAGDLAKKALGRKQVGKGRLLAAEFIIQVGDLTNASSPPLIPGSLVLTELEDLIPPESAAAVAVRYAVDIIGTSAARAQKITAGEIQSRLADGLFGAVKGTVSAILGGDAHIEKVGFARILIDLVVETRFTTNAETALPGVGRLEENFASLFRQLSPRLRSALKKREDERVSDRLDRTIERFKADRPHGATREQAGVILGELDRALDPDSPDLDIYRLALQRLRRDFHLDEDLTTDVQSYNTFLERLEEVRYSPLVESQVGEKAAFTIGVPASQDPVAAVPEDGSRGEDVGPAEAAESALEAEESTAPTASP